MDKYYTKHSYTWQSYNSSAFKPWIPSKIMYQVEIYTHTPPEPHGCQIKVRLNTD